MHLWEGAMREEMFPHTRTPLHWRRWGVGTGEAADPQRRVQQQGCRRQGREIPTGSVPTSTHQPERLVCSPAGVSGGWELRLGLQRSDPRERTGVGCVNTA